MGVRCLSRSESTRRAFFVRVATPHANEPPGGCVQASAITLHSKALAAQSRYPVPVCVRQRSEYSLFHTPLS